MHLSIGEEAVKNSVRDFTKKVSEESKDHDLESKPKEMALPCRPPIRS